MAFVFIERWETEVKWRFHRAQRKRQMNKDLKIKCAKNPSYSSSLPSCIWISSWHMGLSLVSSSSCYLCFFVISCPVFYSFHPLLPFLCGSLHFFICPFSSLSPLWLDHPFLCFSVLNFTLFHLEHLVFIIITFIYICAPLCVQSFLSHPVLILQDLDLPLLLNTHCYHY